MSADGILKELCASAGGQAEEVLGLLLKILRNIADNPAELKFRRLNAGSAKLQSGLLCYTKACEFLSAMGFVRAADGTLELPQGVGAATIASAQSAVSRQAEGLRRKRPADQLDEGASRVRLAYREAVEGGARGAGLAEVGAILQHPGGPEALQVLERILENVRRFPDDKRYKCVNLAKAAGQKALPALPLLQVAGFQRGKLPTGEDCLQLARPDIDVLHRVWAMAWWATRPPLPLDLSPFTGPMSHCLGALLGAAIGDALGAPLGGKGPYEVSATEIDAAMEMCGGGIWGVAPGQATSVTDLALCLADSLAAAKDPIQDFPLDDIALRYGKWGKTQPFRAERACSQAFSGPLSAYDMAEHAKQVNRNSMGSGALVRCISLAALGAARSAQAAAAALAGSDTRLSHPNPAISYASSAYVLTAGYLAANGGDRKAALGELQKWIEERQASIRKGKSSSSSPGQPGGWSHLSKGEQARMGQRTEEASWAPPGEELVACEELVGWLNKAFNDGEEISFSSSSAAALLNGEVGSVEIPLMHAFRHLKSGSTFEVAMRATLAGGGDSSTSASVVGGLLGAAVGLEGLPRRWVQAVLASDSSLGHVRPPEYHPNRLPGLLQTICAPRAGAIQR
mmetsp:Transcript_9390/g.26329  ORF Transcript_9390/g.26329 Transcript_9390/m.26329 type:complete len:627 (+) Transcript_9390:52-1932(+)